MWIKKTSIVCFSIFLLGCGGGSADHSPPSSPTALPNSSATPDIPAKVNMTTVSGWGSSSMEIMANSMNDELKSRFSATYYDHGHSGEYSSHIAARLGAIPLYVALDKVSYEDPNIMVLKSADLPSPMLLKPFEGYLNGRKGELKPSGDRLLFLAAEQVPVLPLNASVNFIPDTVAFKSSPIIVWAGKNDIIQRLPTQPIIANTQAMCNWLNFKNYCLVIGMFSNSSWTKDRPEMTEMVNVNQAYQNLFGSNYIDVQRYLMSTQIWVDTGITPTQQDLIQQQNGIKPVSLSIDDFHLNQRANKAIAKRIADKMVELGWYVDKR